MRDRLLEPCHASSTSQNLLDQIRAHRRKPYRVPKALIVGEAEKGPRYLEVQAHVAGSAYAASKAAVVRFTETMALEIKDRGIDINAIAPGLLATRLTDQLLAAGPAKIGQAFYDRISSSIKDGGTPLAVPAKLCVWLASAASDGVTGKLIAAVWDPYESFPQHLTELNGTDIYTLRRIVPKDRGMAWGNDP